MSKVIKTKEVQITEYKCDICDQERNTTCNECRRDICSKHTIRVDPVMGDYADYYCEECYKIMEPFNSKIKELQGLIDEQHELMDEKLEEFRSSQSTNKVKGDEENENNLRL